MKAWFLKSRLVRAGLALALVALPLAAEAAGCCAMCVAGCCPLCAAGCCPFC